VVTHW